MFRACVFNVIINVVGFKFNISLPLFCLHLLPSFELFEFFKNIHVFPRISITTTRYAWKFALFSFGKGINVGLVAYIFNLPLSTLK